MPKKVKCWVCGRHVKDENDLTYCTECDALFCNRCTSFISPEVCVQCEEGEEIFESEESHEEEN